MLEMAAEQAESPTAYVNHHMTHLTVGHGFWTWHIDTIVTSAALIVVLVAGSHEVSELAAASASGDSLPEESDGADDDEHQADDAHENGGEGGEPGVDLAAHATKPRA